MIKKLSVLITILVSLSVPSHAALIAQNDGSVRFSSTLYLLGIGNPGDANFVDEEAIAALVPFGDAVIIKVTMGDYVDYFKPISGSDLQQMLMSNNQHLWASSPGGAFIAPAYFGRHFGGSVFNDSGAVATGRRYLPFWGSDYVDPQVATDGIGGCCHISDGDAQSWGRAFTLETVFPIPDSDSDGIADKDDNCTEVPNPDQRDTNNDGFGNACDADLDNDCAVNFEDLGIMKSVFFMSDADADFNSDGSVNFLDLGIMKASFFSPPGPSAIPNDCE